MPGTSKSGRRPLAQETNEALGAYKIHPGRRNNDIPKPRKEPPPKPAVLEQFPEASLKWDHLTETLGELNVLAACDSDLLEMYSIAHHMYRMALADVKVFGHVTINDKGTAVKSPYASSLERWMTVLLKLIVEMGLSPSSRSKVVVPKPDEYNPYAELVARMGRG